MYKVLCDGNTLIISRPNHDGSFFMYDAVDNVEIIIKDESALINYPSHIYTIENYTKDDYLWSNRIKSKVAREIISDNYNVIEDL